MKTFKLGNKIVGGKPFIIAEMSANHNNSLERALKIVEAAAKAGADALKVQTYTPDTMTLNICRREFKINDPSSPWYDKTLYSLYKESCMPWKWHKPIFDLCKKLGIIGFSTAYDETSVDFLEKLGVPAYKIASFENNHIPLIQKVMLTKKPVFISTGMAYRHEIYKILESNKSINNHKTVLLKCVSDYPSDPSEMNLLTMNNMKRQFRVQVGISDHTLGIASAITSIVLGGTVIEKHLTLSRKDGGIDSSFSMEPHELKILVEEAHKAFHSIGNVNYRPTKGEQKYLKFKRSIYVSKNSHAGDTITKENILCIRQNLGLHPEFYNKILGKKFIKDVKMGTPFSLDLYKNSH